MPTPVDILLHPVSLAVFALYAALMAWEAIAPARDLLRVPGSKIRGLASFAVFFWLSSYLPLLWDGWLARFQLVDLSGRGTVGGIVVGLVVYEVCACAYHRAVHASDTLWRVFHQMPHSAERPNTHGAFWFAPTDMIAWTFVGTFCPGAGRRRDAGGGHGDPADPDPAGDPAARQYPRTPRWLGYLVRRPESHSIHHGRGIQAFNDADRPMVDMLFGTAHNPETFEAETGLVDGGSAQLGALLTFRDVAPDA